MYVSGSVENPRMTSKIANTINNTDIIITVNVPN